MITGATGFVGKHLVQMLHKKKHYSIRVAVRPPITALFDSKIPIHLISDISGNTDWSEALEGCNVVIHTAARVHVMKESVSDPLQAFRRVNVEGTLNLAKQAVRQGVKRFIFISTIKVNGELTPKDLPFKSDDFPKPEDPYAVSKYEAEQGLLKIAKETALEVVIIRPPLVYGAGVKGNFQRMVKLLSMGIPLPLGRLNNKRSFISVYNLASLIELCVDHPDAVNQIFLASDGRDLSTTELLSKLSQVMGKKNWLIPVPYRLLELSATLCGKHEIFQRLGGSLQVDFRKTVDLLGWRPEFGLDESLKMMMDGYFEQ